MQELLQQISEQLQVLLDQSDIAGRMGQVVVPAVGGMFRILMAILGIWILVRCTLSLFRERNNREVWGSLSLPNGVRYDLLHWENMIGRARSSDVVLEFPSVSRNHAAMMRDDKGNWTLHPLQAKNGTLLNQRPVTDPTPLEPGDEVALGGVALHFYPISEQEERDQAQRLGVARRPMNPSRTLGYLTIFQLLMAIQCMLVLEMDSLVPVGVCFGVLCGAMWGLYAIYRVFQRTAFEAESLAFFLCTLSFGIIAAYSPHALYQQTMALALGIVAFFLLSLALRDLKIAVSLRWPVAALTGALLSFNLLFGQRLFGAKNWVSLGPISFQPSEFVKIAFIIAGAATLERLFANRNLIFTTLFAGFCVGCLALMSDFGTALVFFVAFLVIAFLRSGNLGFLVMMGAGAALGCGIILHFKPYIANRFAAWRHVWEYATTTGYQQTRTMSAIAGGGLFGKGPEDAWLKNVAAANTDLVFGVVSEEFGLLLALCAVAALIVLALFAIKCAGPARSSFYTIASCTAAAMMVFQATLNVFGSLDLFPLTGVTLPFVSMGGSSMISCWGLLAFLKAADTRRNASFTTKRLTRLRDRHGWQEEDTLYPTEYPDVYPDEEDDAEEEENPRERRRGRRHYREEDD